MVVIKWAAFFERILLEWNVDRLSFQSEGICIWQIKTSVYRKIVFIHLIFNFRFTEIGRKHLVAFEYGKRLSCKLILQDKIDKTIQMSRELKFWHRNGQLEKLESYRNGNQEGIAKWWYSNGQLEIYEFYRHGHVEGMSRYWLPNGRVLTRQFYRNGMLIDRHFNWKKECAFLKLKRLCIGKSFSFNSFLISDLSRFARI